ncbi:MAG: carbohydrate binding family 9 domain-containing protein, partial [Gemmatimonadetes bacterium]|nr:carbohydrate binding family 9 domain-containing protein [Gemmatimonadota bacterium]
MLTGLFLLATLATEPDSIRYSGRMGELEVSPPKLVDPGINIDGRLDEQAWGTAAILGGFTQYIPIEGVDPTEPTEVRVFYTDEAIYFGIRAYDSDPDEILARFGERDRVTYNDDWVRIILDTFDDRRQAYAFSINPLGLQSDGLIVEGSVSGFGGGGGGGGGHYRGGGGGGGGSYGGRV